MVLETFVAINSGILASKMIHTKIKEEMSNKIIEEGLYHVTDENSADLILASGYIKASNNLISMGSKKCYFFAGCPSHTDLSRNVASSSNKYEFTAIKIDLKKDANENEIPKEKALNILSNFRQRSFNDDSITYKGKCNILDKCAMKVQMVLDIDENGKIFSREKTKEEIEKGKYVPSEELIEKLNLEQTKSEAMKQMLKAYPLELKNTYSKMFSKIVNFLKRNRKNQNLLSDTSLFKNDKLDKNNNEIFNKELNNLVNSEDEISKKDIENKRVDIKEKVEEKEKFYI